MSSLIDEVRAERGDDSAARIAKAIAECERIIAEAMAKQDELADWHDWQASDHEDNAEAEAKEWTARAILKCLRG